MVAVMLMLWPMLNFEEDCVKNILFVFWLFIHRSIIWIYVMNRVRPASWLSLCGKNLRWTLHANCSTRFFRTEHACRQLEFYHFVLLSLALTLLWGSYGQCEAKHIGFIFLHTFQLIKMEFDEMIKQFNLNILRLHFHMSYWNKGENPTYNFFF